MGDLARELRQRGHTVKVLTTTPHYNLSASALQGQPMKSRWGGLFKRSEFHAVQVWHVSVGAKEEKIGARVIDFLRFHVLSLLVGSIFLGGYDVVLAPSPPLSIGVIAWLLAVIRGAPSIYNVQEIYPDFAVNQGIVTSPRLVSAMKLLERFVYRISKRIVVISPWFAKIIGPRGIPVEKLIVIPNFVNTDLYRPLPRDNDFSREHDLNREFIIEYGGNVGLSLDLESVLYAATALRDLPIRFIFVGDGVRMKWLLNEVSVRQLGNVSYLGYQPREMMPLINASCDLAMIPMKSSTTTDTFPSKIYTILACGKSVLASADDDSELSWMIREWRCGRVVRPEDPAAFTDAVRRAYDERALLAQEGEAGRARVLERYSKEAVGTEYDRLLNGLVLN
jgi:colanic acid biosynthesis glycosyl transferase WcaI